MKVTFTASFSKMFFDLTDSAILQKLADIWEASKTKSNEFVTVTIELPKRPRSTGYKSQNHHFNGDCQTIATETGNSFADVKKYVKQKAIDRGYPMLLDDSGNVKLDLFGNVQGISESDASVEECALLIDTAHQLAAELNIKLEE
jgi:hypothetical protein